MDVTMTDKEQAQSIINAEYSGNFEQAHSAMALQWVVVVKAYLDAMDEIARLREALIEVEEMAKHQEYDLDDMCYQLLNIAHQALEGVSESEDN